MKGGAMAQTKLEQKVLDIKDRIKLFRLTYAQIFKKESIEERPKRRTLRDIEQEQSRHN